MCCDVPYDTMLCYAMLCYATLCGKDIADEGGGSVQASQPSVRVGEKHGEVVPLSQTLRPGQVAPRPAPRFRARVALRVLYE